MEAPKTLKQLQCLNGRIAALNRFVSRSIDKCLPFFKVLRKKGSFEWTVECEQALEQLKNYLCSAPLLAKPLPGEKLHLYLAVSDSAISSALIKQEGCLMKWALELSGYDIQFGPRTALKGQAVADFIAELTPPSQSTESNLSWMIYVDGSSNERECGAGILLLAPGGERFEYALRFNFRTSNNKAEYETLLAGLRVAKGLGATHIKVFSDSQLIVNQIKEEYQTKDPRMENKKSTLTTYEVNQVPRSENSNADALAKLASAYETDLARSVPVEILDSPSILKPDVMEIDTPSPSWMDPILEFIKGNPPQDSKEQKRMARRAARFILRDGVLYRRGFSLPLLKCVTPEEGLYILREIHEGVCGNHSGARSLSAKVVRQGYYWPTVEHDAKQFVKTCDNCQRFASIIHQPPELLTPISAPWPFAQWGVDIIGPFPLGKGQTKFVVVAVDYFTKWAEAEALSHITKSRVTSFIWSNIICRFGIPNTIVTDNGKQFDNAKFKDFCRKLGISHLSLTQVGKDRSRLKA
ncbi:uncharacterized protein LOC111024661 [Momordica charantia]|uniref:Uncharacterized protein LOC111024661 n=1 Tax=Momordica charantia TaxID=3673 RepID=A0A6J1DWA1_MOMCH|nr:uncharacterized protein LOC111024661 [Momordica charantia]